MKKLNLNWLRLKSKVKGVFDEMPYTPLLPDGDSSPYFGTYEGQRFGKFDTSTCWNFAGCEIAETRLETLWKLGYIPQELRDWLKDNGYIDEDGDFYLSRRWVAILSGAKNNGNFEINFWKIASVAGLITNKMLSYDPDEAKQWITQEEFNNDYFNIQDIDINDEIQGAEFIKRFEIKAESLPGGDINKISTTLQTYLKEGSLQIGIPVPQDGSWNQELVDYPVGRYFTDHSVELYKFDPVADPEYPFFVYDSYKPHLKRLSKNYVIPIMTRVRIWPKLQPKPVLTSEWTKFWANVSAWLKGKPFPYPSVPVGNA